MPENTDGKNFIDFILDAKDNEPLLRGFTEAKTPEALKDFFAAEGYSRIDSADIAPKSGRQSRTMA